MPWFRATVFLALTPLSATAQRQGPPRLGVIHFPTSAGPVAQAHFEQGVLWMHSFEYDSAASSFRKAQAAEPSFALAYWGEAMTHNHPLWNERNVPAARVALLKLGPTPDARAAKAKTSRERAWLNAAEVLWMPLVPGRSRDEELRWLRQAGLPEPVVQAATSTNLRRWLRGDPK